MRLGFRLSIGVGRAVTVYKRESEVNRQSQRFRSLTLSSPVRRLTGILTVLLGIRLRLLLVQRLHRILSVAT